MGKNILIVDDSASIRQVVKINLSTAGHSVVEAVDGQDALTKVQAQKPDLIISDINMPNMDGLTFVRKLKENPDYKFIPIIMLTTESQEEKKMEGMSIGVKAWLVKPFKPDQLMTAVSRLLV